MFIKNPEIMSVGDVYVLESDASALSGTITRGSRVRIVDLGDMRGPTIEDLDSGVRFYEAHPAFVRMRKE